MKTLRLLPLLALLIGCGGHGGSPAAAPSSKLGHALVRIVWPATGRVIPAAANDIQLALSGGGLAAPVTKTVSRPAGTTSSTVTEADFGYLKPGAYTMAATAYAADPSTTTANPALATSSAALVVTANATTNFSITMGSTIDHIRVDGLNPASSMPSEDDHFNLFTSGAKSTAAPSGPVTPSFLVVPPEDTPASKGTSETVTFSAKDAVDSDLYLFVAAGNITVSVGAGLTVSTPVSVGSGVATAIVSRDDTNLAPSTSTITVNYSENGALVATFQTGVQLVGQNVAPTGTIVNAPSAYTNDPGDFVVTSTLRENPAGNDPGKSYPGTNSSNALRFSFAYVVNRNRGFVATTVFSVKAVGGGTVPLFTKTDSISAYQDVGFTSDFSANVVTTPFTIDRSDVTLSRPPSGSAASTAQYRPNYVATFASLIPSSFILPGNVFTVVVPPAPSGESGALRSYPIATGDGHGIELPLTPVGAKVVDEAGRLILDGTANASLLAPYRHTADEITTFGVTLPAPSPGGTVSLGGINLILRPNAGSVTGGIS